MFKKGKKRPKRKMLPFKRPTPSTPPPPTASGHPSEHRGQGGVRRGRGGSRRRWRGDGGSLHAIVREVLHLDRLSDEQLGLAALLVLDGLVDVHDLFANVLVHFGQPLRNLGAVGRLLGHPVVETLCGERRREHVLNLDFLTAEQRRGWATKTRTSLAALGLHVTSDDLQLAGRQRRLGQSVLLLLGGHSGYAAVLEGFRAPDHHGEVLGELGVALGALQLVPLLLLHPNSSAQVHLSGKDQGRTLAMLLCCTHP